MHLEWSQAGLTNKDAAAAGTVSPERPLSYAWHTPSPDHLSFATHNDSVWQPGAHEHQSKLSNIDGFDAPTSVSRSNSRPSSEYVPSHFLSRQSTSVASPVQNHIAFPKDVQSGQVRLVENASSERIPTFFSSQPSQIPFETRNPTVTVTSSNPIVPSTQDGVLATTKSFIPLINSQATSYNSSPQPTTSLSAEPPPYQQRFWDADDMAEAYDGIEISSPPIETFGHQRYPVSSTSEPSIDGALSILSSYRPALVTVPESSPVEPSSPYESPIPPTDSRPLACQQGPLYIVGPTFPDHSRPNIRRDHSYSSLSTASPSGSHLTPATRPPYVSPGQSSQTPSQPGSDQYLFPTTSHLGSEQYLSPTASHAGSGSIYATSSTSLHSSLSGYPSRLPERLVMPTPMVTNSVAPSGSHYHTYSPEDALQPRLYSDRSPSVPLFPRPMSAEPSPMAQNIPMHPNPNKPRVLRKRASAATTLEGSSRPSSILPNKPRVLRKRASAAVPLKGSGRPSSMPPNMPLDFSADNGLQSMTIPSPQNAVPPPTKKKGKCWGRRLLSSIISW